MLYSLIFGLILVMIVPGSEGFDWIGTFTLTEKCESICCCPSKLEVTKHTNGSVTGSLTASGLECPTNTQITILDANSSQVVEPEVATFNMDAKGNLKVLVHQVNGTHDQCNVTMTRSGSSSNGNPNKPSGSGASTSGSEALLNHSSISIALISLIMITTFLKYI